MSKDNIVFLDFDGVLNCEKFFDIRIDENHNRNHKWSILKHFDKSKIKECQIKRISKVEYFYTEMSANNINNFIRIFKNIPNVKIVLSTSWRHGATIHDWNIMFKAIPNWNFPIIGITRNIDVIKDEETETSNEWIKQYDKLNHKPLEFPTRGVEIQDWLDNNEYSNYIILDDCEVMLPEQQTHYIQTVFKDGLTMRQESRIIGILNRRKK